MVRTKSSEKSRPAILETCGWALGFVGTEYLPSLGLMVGLGGTWGLRTPRALT